MTKQSSGPLDCFASLAMTETMVKPGRKIRGREAEVGLTIETEEACRLAQEFASLTGETTPAAVTQALRERLERVRRERRAQAKRLLAIGRDCAAHLNEPLRSGEIDARERQRS